MDSWCEIQLHSWYTSALLVYIAYLFAIFRSSVKDYLLSQLKSQGLASDPLQIIYNALIISKLKYTLPAIAGLLPQTDKSRLNVIFFIKTKCHGLCQSDFGINCQLIDTADSKLK